MKITWGKIESAAYRRTVYGAVDGQRIVRIVFLGAVEGTRGWVARDERTRRDIPTRKFANLADAKRDVEAHLSGSVAAHETAPGERQGGS